MAGLEVLFSIILEDEGPENKYRASAQSSLCVSKT